MANARRFHAALRDPRRMAHQPALVSSLVRRVLSDQGIAILDDGARPGEIRTDVFHLSVRLAPLPERAPLRLVLTMTEIGCGADSGLDSDLVLIVVTYRLAQALRPAAVEWLDSEAIVPTDTFLGAFDGVDTEETAQAARTRRINSRPLMPAGTAEDTPVAATATASSTVTLAAEDRRIAVQLRRDSFAIPPTRAEKARHDLQRLTAWAMTGCVATLSLPVAASMVAVNLIRGEDFRLNTQVLALTGLVGTVSGFGL